MNYLELLKIRNEARQWIKISNRVKNAFRWAPNDTPEHIGMCFSILKYLKERRIEFYSEAVFIKNMGRCDILVSDWQRILEVFKSEKDKSMKQKTMKYPYPVTFIDANQKFDERLIL